MANSNFTGFNSPNIAFVGGIIAANLFSDQWAAAFVFSLFLVLVLMANWVNARVDEVLKDSAKTNRADVEA